MTESMLRAAGLRAIAAGNVGTPILDAIRDPQGYDVIAVELSSFQLHWSSSLSPLASVCLNVAEDHVDWHGSYEGYLADKAKIYANTKVACIYNADQSETERMVEDADVVEGCRAVGFTTGMPAVSMVGMVENLLVDRAFIEQRKDSAAELASLADLGEHAPRHTVANALAAAALVRAYGVEPIAVRDGLRNYEPGDHRIQPVARLNDILWVNDSKATNPHAAAASLASFGSVVWIAGGLSKGVSYDDLVRSHASRLRSVILIGADSADLRSALARHAPEVRVIDAVPPHTGGKHASVPTVSGDEVMALAVAAAAEQAQPGDTVLMAPAAASMDQFASYAHRGGAFIEAVRGYVEGQAPTPKEP
jgi:UDP-N-acetylmuramoylalanine--D-glutamate ligase